MRVRGVMVAILAVVPLVGLAGIPGSASAANQQVSINCAGKGSSMFGPSVTLNTTVGAVVTVTNTASNGQCYFQSLGAVATSNLPLVPYGMSPTPSYFLGPNATGTFTITGTTGPAVGGSQQGLGFSYFNTTTNFEQLGGLFVVTPWVAPTLSGPSTPVAAGSQVTMNVTNIQQPGTLKLINAGTGAALASTTISMPMSSTATLTFTMPSTSVAVEATLVSSQGGGTVGTSDSVSVQLEGTPATTVTVTDFGRGTGASSSQASETAARARANPAVVFADVTISNAPLGSSLRTWVKVHRNPKKASWRLADDFSLGSWRCRVDVADDDMACRWTRISKRAIDVRFEVNGVFSEAVYIPALGAKA